MNAKFNLSLLLCLLMAAPILASGPVPLLSDEHAPPLRNTISVVGIDHEEANLMARVATVAPNVTFLSEISGRGIFGQRDAEMKFPDLGFQFIAAHIVPIDGYVTGILKTSGLNSFSTSLLTGFASNDRVLMSGGYRWRWFSSDETAEISKFTVDQTGFILNSVIVPVNKIQVEVCWMGDIHQSPEIETGLFAQIAENIFAGCSATIQDDNIMRCFHLGIVLDNFIATKR